MDADLPHHINYWITSTLKHDCFFNVGLESGSQERIGAVKILLMGHSEVFRKMLDCNESALAETGVIRVPDSDPDTFKNLLKCIYGGTEIVVRKKSFEECLRLLYLCEKYLLTEINYKISTCLLEVHQPLSVNNVLISLLNPACLGNQNLADALSKIIQTNTEKIINDSLFESLDLNALMFIVKQEILSVKEIDLWRAILQWAVGKLYAVRYEIQQNPIKYINSLLLKFLQSIRFCTMDARDFCRYVVPNNVLTQDQISKICMSIGTRTTVENIQGVNNDIVHRYRKPSTEILIIYILQHLSTFSGPEQSKQIEMNGCKWNIMLQVPETEMKSLSLYLQCEPLAVTRSWKCCASAKLMIVNHIGKPNKIRSFKDQSFAEEECGWGFEGFISWEKLVNPQKGFVKNDSIEVRVEVEIKSQ